MTKLSILLVFMVLFHVGELQQLDLTKSLKEIEDVLERKALDTLSESSSCNDMRYDCSWLKQMKPDQFPKDCQNKYHFISKSCQKTCGNCNDGTSGTGGSGASGGSVGSCKDISTKCAKYKEVTGANWSQRCSAGAWIRSNCKNTCGLCNGGSGGSSGGSGGSSGGSGGSSGGSGGVTTSGFQECNANNKGHCFCGDASQGFKTYVFKIDGVTRCFTVYHPGNYKVKLPVMFTSQCYGKDRLESLSMTSIRAPVNKAAQRYGYARIGLSTPDGHWSFGNNNIVNDRKPMPCSNEDSKDIAYVRAIIKFIDANPSVFDGSRIWAEGFSQNSMFSAYIGFCFSDRVLGVWQGGSGMALTGKPPYLPGCQGQCTASDFSKIRNCNQCKAQKPCTECQYWPIYPCYQPKRAVIDCLVDYTNDYIASDRQDPEGKSTSQNMYKRLVDEGHDARLFRFSKSRDGTISGGHRNPQNGIYWQLGCLGITPLCSSSCDLRLSTCMESGDTSTAAKRASAFNWCMESLDGECKTCSPTLKMLEQSEKPVVSKYKNFGALKYNTNDTRTRPLNSKCDASQHI